MKKIYSIIVLLALVLMSTAAMAVSTNNELCLVAFTEATETTPSTERTLILSYAGLTNGHVIFYGESCIIIAAVGLAPEVRNCMPVFGSGILYDDNLEIAVQGVETIVEYGARVLLSGVIHVLLPIDTLDGTYSGESVYYIGGQRQELFESGEMSAVKCPRETRREERADRRFEKAIKRLDKLGNEDENDAAFRTMQADLQACMQPGPLGEAARIAFSEKYNVPLSEVEKLVGDNSAPIWHILCEIELATPGVIVWRIRADLDGWNYTCGQQDVGEYCYRYSDVCNHWIWAKGCLESKTGHDCFEKDVDPKVRRCQNARGACRSGCTLLSLRPECEAACDREYEHCVRY